MTATREAPAGYDAWMEGIPLWKTVPGASGYEASYRGKVRSLTRRNRAGARIRGRLLSARQKGGSDDRYLIVGITFDNGDRRTMTVQDVVLLTYEGPCPPGLIRRHWNDVPTDNRWAPGGELGCLNGYGNLVYGDDPSNRADRRRNNPKPPKVIRLCEPHGQPCKGRSATRCAECIRLFGIEAAALLRSGLTPSEAARRLGYRSPEGLVQQAARYGGYREASLTASLVLLAGVIARSG